MNAIVTMKLKFLLILLFFLNLDIFSFCYGFPAGDIVDVYYYEGTTDVPLSSYSISNSFLGFRIAAE